jgi:hypothetical protein
VRTTTFRFGILIVTLAAIAVAPACITKEEKHEDNKAGAAPPPPPPAPPPPEPARSAMAVDQKANYAITAAAANKCLQFGGRNTNEQALAEIAPCDKSPAQAFKLQPAPGNYYRFVSALSGKCLDVQSISPDDGVLVQQFSCNGGPNQDWIIADAGPPGTVRLVARHSGKVLDVKDSKTADGTPVIQWTWRSAPNEQFKLIPLAAAAAPAAPAKGAPAGEGKTKKEKGEKADKADKGGKAKT